MGGPAHRILMANLPTLEAKIIVDAVGKRAGGTYIKTKETNLLETDLNYIVYRILCMCTYSL